MSQVSVEVTEVTDPFESQVSTEVTCLFGSKVCKGQCRGHKSTRIYHLILRLVMIGTFAHVEAL